MTIPHKCLSDAVKEVIFLINKIKPAISDIVHLRNNPLDSKIKLERQLRNATSQSETADRRGTVDTALINNVMS